MIQDIHSARQKVRANEIVRGVPPEVLPRGKFPAASIVSGSSEISGIAIVLYARILFGVGATISSLRSVEQLSVKMSSKSVYVCSMRLNRNPDVLIPVIDGHTDANPRSAGSAAHRLPLVNTTTTETLYIKNNLSRVKCLGEIAGRVCFQAANSHQALKRIVSEPVLVTLGFKTRHKVLDLQSRNFSVGKEIKKLGLPKSPSYLGISYSRMKWLRQVFQVN